MRTAERALEYKQAFEKAGVAVQEILVEGRKICLIIDKDEETKATGLSKIWSDK